MFQSLALKKTILVVEDDNDLLLLMQMALKSRFETVLKSEAEDAWEYLQSCSDMPSAVLLDLSLGSGMSSEDFLKKVRNDKRLSQIKIILASGWDDLETRCQEMGADGWLKKPFDLSKLLEATNSL